MYLLCIIELTNSLRNACTLINFFVHYIYFHAFFFTVALHLFLQTSCLHCFKNNVSQPINVLYNILIEKDLFV